MRSNNGNNTAEDTRSAHQTAYAAREAAVQTLLDAAAKIRANTVSNQGFVTGEAGKLAHELELNANYLQSRTSDSTPRQPVQKSGWWKLLIAFSLGFVVGWLLRGDGE